MIFIEERIRAIDRRIADTVGAKRYNPGELVYPEVWWKMVLHTRAGAPVHMVYVKVPHGDVQQQEVEETAAKVIAGIETGVGDLKEALHVATHEPIHDAYVKIREAAEHLALVAERWSHADTVESCNLGDAIAQVRVALGQAKPKPEGKLS